MYLASYLYGMLTAVYAVQGVFFVATRRRKAPFRMAYGLMMLWGFVSLLVTCANTFYGFFPLGSLVTDFVDIMIFPFYFLELFCIVHQNVSVFPWRRRLFLTLMMEIPILIGLVIALSTEWQYLYLLFLLLFLGYTFYVFGYMLVHLRRYQRLLDRVSSANKRQGVRWVWYILVLSFSQFLLYALTDWDSVFLYTLYPVVSMSIVMAHGFFIYRQDPVNTRRMLNTSSGVLADPEAVASKRKRLQLLLSELETFEQQHPGFTQRLRESTTYKLSQHDLFLCMLIAKRARVVDIAKRFDISPASAEVARHRLRSKLNIGKGEDMNQFILGLKNPTK